MGNRNPDGPSPIFWGKRAKILDLSPPTRVANDKGRYRQPRAQCPNSPSPRLLNRMICDQDFPDARYEDSTHLLSLAKSR